MRTVLHKFIQIWLHEFVVDFQQNLFLFISESYSHNSFLNMSEKDDKTKFQIICEGKDITIGNLYMLW